MRAILLQISFTHLIFTLAPRRTDKVGTEAAFHPVEEYMAAVLEWFRAQQLTGPGARPRVYLASDDPRVLGECRDKYPHVEFFGDQNVAKSAALSSRCNHIV